MEKTSIAKSNRGYTLIEVIIVILIMAILTAGTVIGFSAVQDSDVKSSGERLVLALNKARQEAVNRENGSVSMRLFQDTDNAYYAAVMYDDGTSDTELYRSRIAGSGLRVSVREDNGTVTTTDISSTPSADPLILTASEKQFHFMKSTGGLQEDYTDIYIEGSKTIDIIVIKETGRSFMQ